MRDLPAFTTENGVATLILSQIPYTQNAYVRLLSVSDFPAFLEECVQFCLCAGADRVFATGHSGCQAYAEHHRILQMRAAVSDVGTTSAKTLPVTVDTVGLWREIYNEKSKKIHNSRWIPQAEEQELVLSGNAYFVEQSGKILGSGMVTGDKLSWVASVVSGAGIDVLKALSARVQGDFVQLEVASTNEKAVQLYEKCGFTVTENLYVWYQVK